MERHLEALPSACTLSVVAVVCLCITLIGAVAVKSEFRRIIFANLLFSLAGTGALALDLSGLLVSLVFAAYSLATLVYCWTPLSPSWQGEKLTGLGYTVRAIVMSALAVLNASFFAHVTAKSATHSGEIAVWTAAEYQTRLVLVNSVPFSALAALIGMAAWTVPRVVRLVRSYHPFSNRRPMQQTDIGFTAVAGQPAQA